MIRGYDPHPLAVQYREMTDEEYARLKASIERLGLLHPIVLYEGKVLDGVHRQRACIATGAEPRYEEYTGDDPEAYIRAHNEARRHLTVAELALKAAKTVTAVHGQGRPKEKVPIGTFFSEEKIKPPIGGWIGEKPVTVKAAAESHGVGERTVNRINKAVEVLGDEKVEELVEQGESVHAIERVADESKGRKEPRAHSGDDEWNTPADVIACVREVLGTIDLDPASNAAANEVVGAREYFDQQMDGLSRSWHGKVFLNPPYKDTDGDTGKRAFIAKLVDEYRHGEVTEACLICPIDISPRWGDPIQEHAAAICTSHRNFLFWKGNDEKARPQGSGSLLVYFGDRVHEFAHACHHHGVGTVFERRPV